MESIELLRSSIESYDRSLAALKDDSIVIYLSGGEFLSLPKGCVALARLAIMGELIEQIDNMKRQLSILS